MIKINESFKSKIYVNLGVSIFFIILLLVSIFIKNYYIFEISIRNFSGILIGIILLNGLEWLRLENMNKK